MGKYGVCAVKAVRLFEAGLADSPASAWRQATFEIFPHSQSSRDKGCPRGAFLGLCEEGMIKGIKSGNYTGSVDNKRYAVAAIMHLKNDPGLANNKKLLWLHVMNKKNKNHNSQMDVVISLWQNGYILGND